MKKLLILALILVMVFTMLAMASPASTAGGRSVGDGEPPDWSQVNPRQGMTCAPMPGPGAPDGG